MPQLPHPGPHPHVEPRQPRAGARPSVNPPVFVWRPRGAATSTLLLARDPELREDLRRMEGLATSAYLPEAPLAAGVWYWTWEDALGRGPVQAFEIAPSAEPLSVPSVSTWKQRLSPEHPRFLIRPDAVVALRDAHAKNPGSAGAELLTLAEDVLAEPHHLPEPAAIADPSVDHAAFIRGFIDAMWATRRFMKGAETLGLAWLVSGRRDFGRAAAERLLSVAAWDPEGPTSLKANDEAHMSILWYGASAADWVWSLLDEAERARVVACLRARGQASYAHLREDGIYGVDKFDSHSGRQIVFLGLAGLAFLHEIPEAREWLDWARPVLCGVWPVWAGDDGAWAEGPAYGMTYVSVMTLFASALKSGVGVDLYRRPFWRNHLAWRRAFWPAYAEWIGFGDHNEHWDVFWRANADLCEVLARETGETGYGDYVREFRAQSALCHRAPAERQLKGLHPLRVLAPAPAAVDAPRPSTMPAPADSARMLSVYPHAGWAALRSAPHEPARDVAFFFRSSPFGSISHSQANNLDFILHVAGKALLMPSGFYDGYGTPHHAHWVWHTKSHNCLTVSDAGQRMRSPEAVGRIVSWHEDSEIVAFLGEADASYPGVLTRCRRHVVYFKAARCLLLVDDATLQPGTVGALQWNVHAAAPFEVDEAARVFRLRSGHASLEGRVLTRGDGYFRVTEGWDPAPLRRFPDLPWADQWHLRYSPLEMNAPRRILGVLLRLDAPGWETPVVLRDLPEDSGAVRIGAVRIGADIRVRIEPSGTNSEHVASIQFKNTVCFLDADAGLVR